MNGKEHPSQALKQDSHLFLTSDLKNRLDRMISGTGLTHSDLINHLVATSGLLNEDALTAIKDISGIVNFNQELIEHEVAKALQQRLEHMLSKLAAN